MLERVFYRLIGISLYVVSLLVSLFVFFKLLLDDNFKKTRFYNLNSWHDGYFYFKSDFKGFPVYIKCQVLGRDVLNEFFFTRIIKRVISDNKIKLEVPNVYINKTNLCYSMVVIEFINATNRTILNSECWNIFCLVKLLNENNIILRDIKRDNFILTPNGCYLIDFTFSAYSGSERQGYFELRNRRVARLLGGNAKPQTYVWDDMFSLNKLFNNLNANQHLILNVERNIGKYTYEFS